MSIYSRRSFFKGTISAGGLVCGGCINVMAAGFSGIDKQTEHKFLKDSEKSMQEMYDFAAKRLFIPRMERMAKYMGKEKFLELMEKAGDEIGAEAAESKVKELGGNSWSDFIAPYKE